MRKFSYGWVVVLGGLVLSLTVFGIIESIAVTFKPLAGEFGWQRTVVSAASMANWISFGLFSIAFGVLSDRFGSRAVVLVGTLVFVAGTLMMSRIGSLWHLYACFGVLLAVGRAAAGVPLTALVTKWFARRQGLALGLVQSQNVGIAFFTPLAVALMPEYGWRGAYVWFGVIAAAIAPLALLMREPRGGAARARRPGRDAGGAPAGLTLGAAVGTRAFWTLNAMAVGCCVCHSCILLHGVNHITDVGFGTATAARAFAAVAAFGMIGRVANGLLADRIGAKWAIAAFLALQALAIPFLVTIQDQWSLYVWAALFGLGYGGPMPVYAMLFSQYFGTRSIGAILGVFVMTAALGMGSGGLMGGVLYDLFGNYAAPFLTSAATGSAAALLALTLPPLPARESAAWQERPVAPSDLGPSTILP